MDFEPTDDGSAVSSAPNGADDTQPSNCTRNPRAIPLTSQPVVIACDASRSLCVLDCMEPLGPIDHYLVINPTLNPRAARFARLIDPVLAIKAAQDCVSDVLGEPGLRQALMTVAIIRRMSDSEALNVANSVARSLRAHPLILNGVDVLVYTVPNTPAKIAQLRSDLACCPPGWRWS